MGGVSREALTCAPPGPRKPARETIARRPAPPRSRRVSSSRRRAPRPSKSPGIHRKNSGPPPSDPGVRASAGLGGGGGSPERTCLARRQANKRRTLESQISPGISHFRIFDRLGVVVETAEKMPLKGFHRSNVLHHDSVGPVSGTTTDPGAHHSGDAFVADEAWPCCGNAANGWNAPTRISMKPGACGAPICAAMPTFSNGS